MFFRVIFVSFIISSHVATLAPVRSFEMFLQRYGYLSEEFDTSSNNADEILVNAIENFQQFAGIKVTGQLNEATKKMTVAVRCGNKDIINENKFRGKRNKIFGMDNKWKKEIITYNIVKYPDYSNHTNINQEIRRAFDMWANYVHFQFMKVNLEPDIKIHFEVIPHEPGTSKSYGWAHAPKDGGNITFTTDVFWTIRTKEGFSFYSAAIHEIGHALGLDHSQVTDSIMYPYLNYDYNPSYEKALPSDDMAAIRLLYPVKTDKYKFTRGHNKKISSKFAEIGLEHRNLSSENRDNFSSSPIMKNGHIRSEVAHYFSSSPNNDTVVYRNQSWVNIETQFKGSNSTIEKIANTFANKASSSTYDIVMRRISENFKELSMREIWKHI